MQNGLDLLHGERGIKGVDKVAHYKWAAPETPGVFELVSKHDLRIPREYQRDLIEHKAIAIAREFSWPAFGVLIVARRQSTLMVIDGQHRHAGALRRSDIDQLPCLVFPSLGVAAEASDFLKTNTMRKPIGAVGKHRAMVEAGDAVAKEIESMAAAAGRVVMGGTPTTSIQCVGAMVRMLNTASSGAALRRVWPVIAEACHGHAMPGEIVEGVTWIEQRLPEGVSLADRRWRSRTVAIGAESLKSAAKKGAAFYGVGGARSWGRGILEIINKALPMDRRLAVQGE